MRSIVNHLSPCILVLIGIGKGNRQHCSARSRSVQIDRRIFHSCFRTEVPINPLNRRIFHSPRPLGHEVVDIIRPVLNSCVAHVGTIKGKNFNNSRMETITRVCRSCTPFYIMNTCSFVNNNQCPFKLTRIFIVNSEVGL